MFTHATSVHRSSLRGLIVSLACACAIVSSACSGATVHSPPNGESQSSRQPVLQFAGEANVGELVTASSLSEGGDRFLFGPVRRFGIKDAGLGADNNGWPALTFEIADPQKDEFRRFTEAFVGRRIAFLIDGEIVSTPTVQSPLSGRGFVEFPGHRTEAEIRALAARIRDPR
jgi:hypothetical protein